MNAKKRRRETEKTAQTFVLDCEAVSAVVRNERNMMLWLERARTKRIDVVTSPLTLLEAHRPGISAARWDWVISRLRVAPLGRAEARAGQQLLTETGLHGHKYAIDAMLAVVARQQPGLVTVFTSDVDDMEKLLPPTIIVRKI